MVISDNGVGTLPATGARVRAFAILAGLACGAVWLVPFGVRAQDGDAPLQAAAQVSSGTADVFEPPAAHPPGPQAADESEPAPTVLARGAVTLLVAANKTGAQRHSDTNSNSKRRRSLAALIRSRLADDANFRNRTRFLARRIDETGRPDNPSGLAFAQTGEEFLDALVSASRRGPIGNLVIYGHAASTALFMREDRGFYGSVLEVAKSSHVVSGEAEEKDEQLRLLGARDMSDFERLLSRGEIRFARNPVIVFAGCGVAGKRDIEPNSLAARMAEITGGKVIASIDVTDQSMARGRNFRNHEYSRRSWVRFVGGQPPERLNTRVIDALRHMSFEGDTVAAGPPLDAAPRRSN